MSENHKEEREIFSQPSKILTPKELLEKRKQYLEQTKANRGPGHNTGAGTKGSSRNAAGHKPRTHRPQGG